jgi:opacity protein-like surface antigen
LIQKTILLLGMLILIARPVGAQGKPKAEIAGVYSVTPAIFGPSCQGGGGSVALNLNNWIGIAGDLNGCRSSRSSNFFSPGGSITNTQFTYLFGPRFSYRSMRRLTPYAQALVGGAHAGTNIPMSTRRGNGFAMTVAVGLDLKLNDRLGLRLAQPEYLMTRVGGVRRDDFRFQTGVVVLVGSR